MDVLLESLFTTFKLVLNCWMWSCNCFSCSSFSWTVACYLLISFFISWDANMHLWSLCWKPAINLIFLLLSSPWWSIRIKDQPGISTSFLPKFGRTRWNHVVTCSWMMLWLYLLWGLSIELSCPYKMQLPEGSSSPHTWGSDCLLQTERTTHPETFLTLSGETGTSVRHVFKFYKLFTWKKILKYELTLKKYIFLEANLIYPKVTIFWQIEQFCQSSYN